MWNSPASVLVFIVALMVVFAVASLMAYEWLSLTKTRQARQAVSASVNRGIRRILRKSDWAQNPAAGENVVEPGADVADAVSPVSDAASSLSLRHGEGATTSTGGPVTSLPRANWLEPPPRPADLYSLRTGIPQAAVPALDEMRRDLFSVPHPTDEVLESYSMETLSKSEAAPLAEQFLALWQMPETTSGYGCLRSGHEGGGAGDQKDGIGP